MAADLPPEITRAQEATERVVAEVVERMEAEGLGRGLIGSALCAQGVTMLGETAGTAEAKRLLQMLIDNLDFLESTEGQTKQ